MSIVEVAEKNSILSDTVESIFWSTVVNSDGKHCPYYQNCKNARFCCLNIIQGDSRDKNKRLNWMNSSHLNCWAKKRIFIMLESLAQEYLKKSNIHDLPVPTDPKFIFNRGYDVYIHYIPLSTCHGAVWSLSRSFLIQINDSSSLYHQRFTIYHEAFHILRKINTCSKFSTISHDNMVFYELLADCFAACLLIPKVTLEVYWQYTKNIDELARLFVVPKSTIIFRLRTLGLLQKF